MIAITGAGEYLDTIRPYDKLLLDKLEIEPYVLSFPTAAGLESEERIQSVSYTHLTLPTR